MEMVAGRLPQEDQLAPLRIETLETQSFKDYERRTIRTRLTPFQMQRQIFTFPFDCGTRQ